MYDDMLMGFNIYVVCADTYIFLENNLKLALFKFILHWSFCRAF